MSSELPSGWATASLASLVAADGEFTDGDWVESKDQDVNGDVRLVQLADVGAGRFIDKSRRYLTSAKARELRCTFLSPGDVLIARMPDPLGRACLFPGLPQRAVTVVDVAVLRPGTQSVEPRWLANAINAPEFRSEIAEWASGTTRNRISRSNLAALELPVPPVSEQRRIVAKLDALLARSKKAREHLDRIPALLDALKRSILAAAFRGDLTADWRKANPDVEPATKLLERIRAERRRRWEEELRAKGKDPKKAKYEEPAPVDESELPELPEGWCWATADELTAPGRPIVYGIIKPGPDTPGGVPYVRISEMVDGTIDLSAVRRCAPDRAALFQRAALRTGDILISKDGTIGRVAWVPPELDGGNITQHVLRFSASERVDAKFVGHMIEAPLPQAWMKGELKGVALQGVNVEDFRRLPLPVAPVAEQRELLIRLKRLLQQAQRAAGLSTALSHLRASLDSSVLSAAFRGDLLPQDPHDEPADVMLARLRATPPAPAAKAPRAAPQAKGPAPVAQEAALSMGDALDVVVGALVAAKRMTAEQVRAATGLGKDDVTPVLKRLVTAGKVRVEGKARGTAYVWVG